MLVNYQQKKEDDYQAELAAASINAGMTIDSPASAELEAASINAGMTIDSPVQSFLLCTPAQPKVSSKRKPSTYPERIKRKRQRAEQRENNRLRRTTTTTDACAPPLAVRVAPSILPIVALLVSDSLTLGPESKPVANIEIGQTGKRSMLNATLSPVPSLDTLSTVSRTVATHRDSFYVTLTN